MKAWVVLLWLLHSGLSQPRADAKRFDPALVDPLTRRSPLDKNFMRFGRSSPSYTEEDEAEEDHDPGAETSKEENFLRSMRGKENFMRFGRAKSDNFMRFGRGNQENFMRFGRAPYDNFMRFGRGKQDNFMRFGRGKQDSYMLRYGRGKEGNFMRFGRGKQDNYMRFGRGRDDNFMRFGRGKQDSYMLRYGRGKGDNFMRFGRGKQDNYMRLGRGKQDSYMRFGRIQIEDESNLNADHSEQSEVNDIPEIQHSIRFGNTIGEGFEDTIPIAMRSGNKGNSNFIRFGRAVLDNSMSNEKPDIPKILEVDPSVQKEEIIKGDFTYLSNDPFSRESKGKDLNLIRFGRQPPSKNDGFIRFGRNTPVTTEENLQETELIPQRLKRSITHSYTSRGDTYSTSLQNDDGVQIDPVRDDLEAEYAAAGHEDDYSRRKRSLGFPVSTSSPFAESDASVDFLTAKVRIDAPAEPDYQSSLFSAGLPNVIVGPEFSLLPDLNPPPAMLKRGRPGDQNFLRLG